MLMDLKDMSTEGAKYCLEYIGVFMPSVNNKRDIERQSIPDAGLPENSSMKYHEVAQFLSTPLLFTKFYANGDLQKYLVDGDHAFPDKRKITWRQAITWSKELMSALTFLKSKQIIHRDIACRNLMLDENLQIKIIDFGLARKVEDEPSKTVEDSGYQMKTERNLPIGWLAKETLDYHKFSYQTDLWAAGVTIWEIFEYSSFKPYSFELGNMYIGNQGWDILSKGLENKVRLGKLAKCGWPKSVWQIISKCFDANPEIRITSKELEEKLLQMLNSPASFEGLTLNQTIIRPDSNRPNEYRAKGNDLGDMYKQFRGYVICMCVTVVALVIVIGGFAGYLFIDKLKSDTSN